MDFKGPEVVGADCIQTTITVTCKTRVRLLDDLTND